jgi:hypothetical protein
VRIAAGFVLILGLMVPYAPAANGAGEDQPQQTDAAAERSTVTLDELASRLRRLEKQNAKLTDQNARLADENRRLSSRLNKVVDDFDRLKGCIAERDQSTVTPAAKLPDPLPPGISFPEAEAASPEPPRPAPVPPAARFLVGERDDELGMFVLVRPSDAQRVPFELRFDLFTQARYFNFARSTGTWVDTTGQRLPVSSFEAVEVTRNFIQFSGFGLDPRLQYNAVVFSSTALNDTVYLGWINYQFSRAFDLRVGNWLVPGTREWYESFRYTMGADRLMATTFFRPNISPGIWAQGEPIDNLHYVAMFANSFNRFNQGIDRIGSAMSFGGTLWWEPRGSIGPGPSDIEGHEQLTPRIGTNLAISREQNQAFGSNGLSNPEDTILRLSNGTPLFRFGALGRGVELKTTAVQLWTIDAALKYHGLGLSGEYFLRWLDDFQAFGGHLPFRSIFDHGALLQAGYFAVPRKLEGFARSSFVTGPFGGGYEWGGGLNWYVLGSRDWRLTFEFLFINHSPAQNILTGYRAGESGSLFQLQWFSDF